MIIDDPSCSHLFAVEQDFENRAQGIIPTPLQNIRSPPPATWLIHVYQPTYHSTICSQRKYPYPKAQSLKGKYDARLEFPEGLGEGV